MSGPKISQYELDQMRKRQLEEAARRRQQLLEEQMRERKRKMEEEIEQKIQQKNSAFQKSMDAISQLIENEQKKQKERIEDQRRQEADMTERKSNRFVQNRPRTLDFEELLEQARKNTDIDGECKENLEDMVRELAEEPVELHSLLGAYLPQTAETEKDGATSGPMESAGAESAEAPSRQEEARQDSGFDALLMQMEGEYQELVSDRAFFKHHREQILRFEEVCKRQQEYHSYQILRDAYYGDFQRLKEQRKDWHKRYDIWKAPFEESYLQYRAACELAGRIPEHYFLNLETVSSDIEELKRKTEELQKEYIQKQESMEVTRILNEVMEEMGYQVLGTKEITKRTGAQVHNTVFSYGDGSGIHVMDSGERITMEIVGLEEEGREIDEEEKDYLAEEQEHFCDSFHEIEKELEKRGVVLKNRLGMLPPSKEYSALMNLEGYTMTEQSKKTKSLSKVDKKAVRKQKSRQYLNGQ